jgi:hypothetical protein
MLTMQRSTGRPRRALRADKQQATSNRQQAMMMVMWVGGKEGKEKNDLEAKSVSRNFLLLNQ